VKAAPAARAIGARKPREGTKQQQVLAMLRRPEGATVAQIAAADISAGHIWIAMTPINSRRLVA
jgi:hypothetical protein